MNPIVLCGFPVIPTVNVTFYPIPIYSTLVSDQHHLLFFESAENCLHFFFSFILCCLVLPLQTFQAQSAGEDIFAAAAIPTRARITSQSQNGFILKSIMSFPVGSARQQLKDLWVFADAETRIHIETRLRHK